MNKTPLYLSILLLHIAGSAVAQGQRVTHFSDGTQMSTGAPKMNFAHDNSHDVKFTTEKKSSRSTPSYVSPHYNNTPVKKPVSGFGKGIPNDPSIKAEQHILNDGLEPVDRFGMYGYADSTHKIIIPQNYTAAEPFHEGRAAVRSNNSWPLNDSGKEVPGYFPDGQTQETIKRWGVIDKTGRQVVPFVYEYIGGYYEGLSLVRKKNKVGYIDKDGKEVIALVYDDGYKFSGGLAGVKKDGKYGYIDKTGKTVIPFQYSLVTLFKEGQAYVKDAPDNMGRGMYTIDTTGREVK